MSLFNENKSTMKVIQKGSGITGRTMILRFGYRPKYQEIAIEADTPPAMHTAEHVNMALRATNEVLQSAGNPPVGPDSFRIGQDVDSVEVIYRVPYACASEEGPFGGCYMVACAY